MKKLLATCAGMVLALAGIVAIASCTMVPGQYSIAGFVTGSVAGNSSVVPIEGATVYLANGVQPEVAASSRALTTLTTNAAGYFEVFDLGPGEYTLMYVAAGYNTTFKYITISASPSTENAYNPNNTVNVTYESNVALYTYSGSVTMSLEYSTVEHNNISGYVYTTVYDAEGNSYQAPLAGVTVQYNIEGAAVTLGTVSTDATGRFAINGLAAGSYLLHYSLAGYIDTYSTAYLGGGTAANPVTTIEAQSMSPLASVGFGKIYGTVAESSNDSNGVYHANAATALAGVTVSYRLVDSATTIASVVTDANGFFQITDLAKGSYVLTYSLAGYELASSTKNILGSGTAYANELVSANYSLVRSAPELVTFTGKTSTAPMDPDANLVLDFDQDVESFTITGGNAAFTSNATTVTIGTTDASQVTVNPGLELSAPTVLTQTVTLNYSCVVDGWTYTGTITVYIDGFAVVSSNVDTQVTAAAEIYPVSIVPTITFNQTLTGYDAANTYLYNSTTLNRVEADVTMAGAVLTITPDDPLDIDSTYVFYYNVQCVMNSATSTASGSFTFYTAAAAAAVPAQVTGFNAAWDSDWDTTGFTFNLNKLGNGVSYRLYAQRTGTTESKLISTTADNGNFNTTTQAITGTVTDDFGDTDNMPLDDNQSLTFWVCAVNADGVEGPASAAVAVVDTVDPGATATADFNLVANYDSNGDTFVDSYRYSAVDAYEFDVDFTSDEPVNGTTVTGAAIVDAAGVVTSLTGLTVIGQSVNGTSTTVTVRLRLAANTYIPLNNSVHIRVQYADRAGNLVYDVAPDGTTYNNYTYGTFY